LKLNVFVEEYNCVICDTNFLVFLINCVVWWKFTDISVSDIITLMMEAASTSVTSIDFYQTKRRSTSEDSHVFTRRRQNLKPHSRCYRVAS
jgi:hypothetical protein